MAFVVAAGVAAVSWQCVRLESPPSDPRAVSLPPSPTPATQESAGLRVTRQVILIALDGVRHQEVFGGSDAKMIDDQAVPDALLLPPERLLPNLYGRVVFRGIAVGAPGHGPPMVASGPNFISLPGYMEMLSGAPVPTCTRNDCGPIPSKTLVDDFRARVSSHEDVGVIASWDPIENAATSDPSGITISTGRHRGATRDWLRDDPIASELLDIGAAAPAFPGGGDYRPDAFTAPLALRYLATKRPRFLFVGLGDTDEYGHLDDYQSYLQSLRFADAFVGDVLRTLDTMGEYGATTTVVVTTDHGREASFRGHGRNHPESAHVWMMAVGGAVPARGVITPQRPHRLADIASSLRAIVGFSDGADEPGLITEMLPEPRTERATRLAKSSEASEL